MATSKIPREQRTWTTIEGKTLRLIDMEESHIINCIKMLEKKSSYYKPVIEELNEELLHRSSLGKELL
jgi:hypothetical protein